MPGPPPTPTGTTLLSPTQRERTSSRVWARELFRREKGYTQVAILASLILIPAWIPVDYFLAPRWLYPFLVLRLLDVGVSLILLVALRLCHNINNVRLYGAISMISTGVFIAVMLPVLDTHYFVYVFGLSLVFWGVGITFIWPLRFSVLTFLVILVVVVMLQLSSYSRVTFADLIGGTFYLVSSAALASATIFMRRRLELSAFSSSFDLELSNEQLSRTLDTLTAMQTQLVESEKLSALGRMLAQLSHEINNPVNVIHNNLPPLADYWQRVSRLLTAYQEQEGKLANGGSDLARMREEVELEFLIQDFPAAHEAMTTAVQRIRTIHENLRTFILGGTTEFGEEDVNASVAATIKMIERSLPADVRIETDFGAVPGLPFKPGELNQVFFNLFDNAMDAVGESGTIRVSTHADSDKVRIEIADDGPGIPVAIRDKVFEPFFSTKGVAGGTGLGLAICHQIVEAHGGSLNLVPSEVGARFVIELPRP